MKDRVDIMLDLETFGTSNDAFVLQIGAVAFDIDTGAIVDSFDNVVDIRQEKDMAVNGNTLAWWVSDDDRVSVLRELIEQSKDMELNSKELLFIFDDWLSVLSNQYKEVYIWGNGISFDLAIIKHQYKRYGLEFPIDYYNELDLRTATMLGFKKSGMDDIRDFKDSFENEDTINHNAFSDCLKQIRMLMYVFN